MIIYQVSDNYLWACHYSQVQRAQVVCILGAGVDIGVHTDEEKNTLDVSFLNGCVEKITSTLIHLSQVKQLCLPVSWTES